MNRPAPLKFLYLYPNMMDLYGDSGNLQILKYRAEKRGFSVAIDRYIIGDQCPLRVYTTSKANPDTDPEFPKPLDFKNYDLIFLGGGSDKEQKVVAKDIRKYHKLFPSAYRAGVFILAICGGFQLFGKFYKDAENNLIEGVGLFDFYTESSTDKKKRCIGNIIIETKLPGSSAPLKIVGFENHGGQTHGVKTPFGRVLVGNGNTFKNEREGLMTDNFLGTYLHGPLLSKNPELSDYILAYCLNRHAETPAKLTRLNDDFELQARQEILNRFKSQF